MFENFGALEWIIAFLGLSFIIIWHEFGHFSVARLFGMRVNKFSLGMGPKLFGITKGETTYQVSWIPFGGYVQIAGMSTFEEDAQGDPRSFINKERWKRILVYVAGPAFNYIMAIVLYFSVSMMYPGGDLLVTEIQKDSAAFEAGLHAKDKIVRIDGKIVRKSADLIKAISERDSIELEVIRFITDNPFENIAELSITVKPHVGKDGKKRMGVAYNFVPNPDAPREDFLVVLYQSTERTIDESARILQALFSKFQGDDSVQFQGPIGVTQELKKAVHRGFSSLLAILAYLSVALGFANLLPIPALDGSKILVLLIEFVGRRDVPEKFQLAIHGIGFLLLIGMLIWTSIAEIF